MNLINVKCTNCGIVMQVDSEKEAAICKNCGEAYVVKNAYENYIGRRKEQSGFNKTSVESFIIRAGELIDYTGADVEVTIPNTVKIIGKKAFKNCRGLEKVKIPESVIEIYGFEMCGIESVEIPDSVKIIEGFNYCSNLKKIEIPATVQKVNGFNACDSLEEAVIKCEVVQGFCYCGKLHNLILQEGIKTIENYTFVKCKMLIDVVFPESVESIGYKDFSECTRLRSITIKNEKTKISDYYDGDEEDCRSFRNCDNLTSVNAPDEWRKKYTRVFKCLEEKQKKQQKDGCYIATSVYGSYDCPEVWVLRRYRDNILRMTWHGRIFIKAYYAISPKLVYWFGTTKLFKNLWKNILDKFVNKLMKQGVENTAYTDPK